MSIADPAHSIQVAPIDGDARRESLYDAYLAHHPLAIAYYSLSYRNLLSRHLGCSPLYLLAEREGRAVGVMPAMSITGPVGTVINSLPFYGSHGFPLADDAATSSALIDYLLAHIEHTDAAAATIVEHPLLPPATVPTGWATAETRVGSWKNLSTRGADDLDALLHSARGSVRQDVRRATRSAMTIEIDNSATDALYRLHRENMERIGATWKQPSFFHLLAETLVPDSEYRIYIAKYSGQTVGALLSLYGGSTVEYFTPAFNRDFQREQPLPGLIVNAMLDARQRGFTRWNWGGSPPEHEGLRYFKSKWGSDEHEYRYLNIVRRPTVFDQTRESLLQSYPGFYVTPFDRLKES